MIDPRPVKLTSDRSQLLPLPSSISHLPSPDLGDGLPCLTSRLFIKAPKAESRGMMNAPSKSDEMRASGSQEAEM